MTLSALLGLANANLVLFQFVVFFAAGLCGVIGHWFKKWSRREITQNLFVYLFVDNVRGTVGCIVALLGAEATAFVFGGINASTDIRMLIGSAFLAGYGIDNLTDPVKP